MNTNMTPKKRILAALLTVILVFSMMPLSVFAANGGEAEVITANGSTINFNSYVDAVGYANRNGGTLKLLDDITVPYSEELDDIPFITGECTLDLNGKSIDYVEVGSVALDEEDEVIKGTPGTLTVTDSVGNGKIENLAVNTGALTVAGGAITELRVESYAATVNITGGEVEQFSLSDSNDEEVYATVSGGLIRNTSINGGTLTVTGGEYPEKIKMDIGGGTSDIALISLGGAVLSTSIKIAGDKFDEAIVRYMRKKHNLLIGERTAEEMKIRIGSAYPRKEQLFIDVKGRNLISGLPQTIVVSSNEMIDALEEPLQAILESVRSMFERTPPELASDVAENGICITGGGALLYGIDKFIAEHTKVPCYIAEDPISCVAIGTGKVLESIDDFTRGAVYDYRRGEYYLDS